jgi:2-methylcitrate dehydratase PrpD
VDVDRVRVSTGAMQMLMLRNERPQTALEAKFSMQFAMASSLVARSVGLSQLSDDFVRSPPIQSLMPRVSTTTTAETMDGSAFAPSEKVEITTVAGKILASEPIVFAKGSKQRPLSREELRAKFVDCLGDAFSAGAKINAFEKLMNLERLNAAADLLPL